MQNQMSRTVENHYLHSLLAITYWFSIVPASSLFQALFEFSFLMNFKITYMVLMYFDWEIFFRKPFRNFLTMTYSRAKPEIYCYDQAVLRRNANLSCTFLKCRLKCYHDWTRPRPVLIGWAEIGNVWFFYSFIWLFT